MFVYFVDIFKYLIGLWVCDYKFYIVFVLKNKYLNIGIFFCGIWLFICILDFMRLSLRVRVFFMNMLG